jgi:MFS family permease
MEMELEAIKAASDSESRQQQEQYASSPRGASPSPRSSAAESQVQHQLVPVTARRQLLVLVSSFSVIFLTIGLNQAYGVFQSYYVSSSSSFLPPDEASNRALIAFVGTLGAGLTWGGSIFVNPLMVRISNMRYITVAGVLTMCVGMILAGTSTKVVVYPKSIHVDQMNSLRLILQVWHLLLTQGLLYGIGSSMLYFPVLSVAPEYFDARRGAAMGIILSGSGAGGLVFSPLTRLLISKLGPRWALRIIGLVILSIGLPIALTASPSRSAVRRPTLVNVQTARKPTFVLQATASLLQAAGNFVPLTFLPDFSSTALGYTAGFAAVLLALSNAVNLVSRIGMGFLADRVGRQNTLALSVLGSALSVWIFWMGASQSQGADGGRVLWLAFIVSYGILSGGYNALFPTTITDLFGIQAYASVNGFSYFVRGLGAFFGSPVGGVILGDVGHAGAAGKDLAKVLGAYRKVIWYDGALLFASALCVIGVRAFDALDKKQWRWRA